MARAIRAKGPHSALRSSATPRSRSAGIRARLAGARLAPRLLLLLATLCAVSPGFPHDHGSPDPSHSAEHESGSTPSPSPEPTHDDGACLLCAIGGAALPAPWSAGRDLPIQFSAAPGDVSFTPPRGRHANPEMARAPPRSLSV